MTAKQFNIDYHQLLGVDRNADKDTISKAFRQLSKRYHPDKVRGQEEKMKLLTMAKVTLLDPDKRAKYEADYKMNYEHGDTQPDLTADLQKLHIGHRLSDDYRAKIEQCIKDYQSIHIIDNMDMFDNFFQDLEQSMLDKKTVFDLDADQLINQDKSDQVMYDELRVIFMAQNFGELAQYILTHQCRSVLTKLYENVNPTHGYELPDKLKAFLQIVKVSSTLHADSHQNRIKGLYEAVLIYPIDECMDCVLKLINNRMTDAHKREVMNMIMNHNLLDEIAEKKQYMHRLACDSTLRSIFKYENAIHKQNIESMEKAMLYMDLCMVYGHPIVLASCLVMASRELMVHMAEVTDAAEMFALKNCVIELCGTVLHFVSTYANPISQLKYSIQVIRLVKRANQFLVDSIRGQTLYSNKNKIPLIGDLDRRLLECANLCVSKSIRMSPFIDTTFDMASDVLYINLINNRLLEKYYQWNIDTYSEHPSAHLYLHSLMEGSWKSWFDEKKFDEYRQNCIKVMLAKTKMSELDVARTMRSEISCIKNPTVTHRMIRYLFTIGCPSFIDLFFGSANSKTFELKPMMNRCDGGWLVPDKNYLNMDKMSFNSVDGLIIDIEQGTFEIIVSTDTQIGPLCDGQDIDEVLKKGLSFSVFSLDQADIELDYHPFQLMRFSPESLGNTRYLSTLLAAVYLLKMIASDTEVSAKPPFEIRQAVDGFLKAMPADLREFFMMKKYTTDFGKVHRFWIENGNIPFYRNVDDNGKLSYEFYYTPMLIKKHLMKMNSHGELVDDIDDSEDELTDDSENESDKGLNPPRKKISAEARFTRRLTQYYDLLGCYFPVLLRLRELAKLSAISMTLKNIYHSLEESKKQVTVPRNDIQDLLENVRCGITYPLCTDSKIEEIYQKVLRDNGLIDDSRVNPSETRRVKNQIRSDLNSAEEKLLIDLPKQLSEVYGLANTQILRNFVSIWLKHGQCNALVDCLCSAIYEKKIEELSKFGNNLKKLGVNLVDNGDSNRVECDSGCKWVPSAFSKIDGRRVYGGVFLRPNTSLQNTKGFQGFQKATNNAGSSANSSRDGPSSSSRDGPSSSSRDGPSSSSRDGPSSSSRGGSSKGGSPPPKPEKTKREEIMEKYGNGKGWPATPVRVNDTYFARPGTSHKTHQGIIIKFGPSGWPLRHNPRYDTRKAAIEAAARNNRGRGNSKLIVHEHKIKSKIKQGTADYADKTKYHNKNYKSDHSPHVHSTDKKGEKLRDEVHFIMPKRDF